MSNIVRFMEILFFALVFCIAVASLLQGDRQIQGAYAALVKNLDSEVAKERTVSEEPPDIPRSEVVAALMTSLSYDVEVEGVLFETATFNPEDPEQFDESMVPAGWFMRRYEYRNDGNVEKVVYKRVP